MHRFTSGSLTVLLTALSQLFFLNSEASIAPKTFQGYVTRVTDGDTIRFTPLDAMDGTTSGLVPSDSKSWAIRMMTTDTAELHLPAPGGVQSQGYWGEEGKAELQGFLSEGDLIEVDSYGVDNYGRVLGKVFKNKKEINFEMLRSGWAALYIICDEKSCDLDPAYRDACWEAVEEGRGIFNPKNPLPELPFIFRSRVQNRPLAKFVGSIRTRKYYAPTDYHRVAVCDRVFFMSEDFAKKKGFKAAR